MTTSAAFRVRKRNYSEGDIFPEGAEGTVLYTFDKEGADYETWVIHMDGEPEGSRLITPDFRFDRIN